MHPLYILTPPSEPAQPPDHWSYSSLKAWRECPRRWWLEKCIYPNVDGRFYPAPVSAAALEGQLIHEIAEEWAKALRRGENPGSMRLRFKLAFREAVAALKSNPRSDMGRVAAAVSVDAGVAKAHELIRDLAPSTFSSSYPSAGKKNVVQGVPTNAEECWIVVDDPPLKGQLDRVRNGVITDYKTGEPDAAHTEQVLFYATLWWLKYREVPQQLDLRYPRSVVSIPVPASNELDVAAAALRSEIEEASNLFQSGKPPSARPDAERCRYCPVRQLCDEYWTSPRTADLRLGALPPDTTSQNSSNTYGDVELTEVPEERRSDGAVFGNAVADGIGSVRVRINPHLCPATNVSVVGARLLAAKLIREGDEVVILTSAGTEVFWSLRT